LSLKLEHERESIQHRYHSLWLILARVGVIALFLPAVIIAKPYRPSYDTYDMIIIVAVGMILGVVYARTQEKLAEHYSSRLAKVDEQDTEQRTT